MKNEVNLINFEDKLPLSISVIQFDTIFRHMHSSAQLLLILKGECNIYVDNKSYHAREDDMIIINPKKFHHIISDTSCVLISVLINIKGFSLEEDFDESIYFNLNTMENKDNPRYEQIRYLVYSIIAYNTMENVNSIYTNRAIAYSFFSQLVNDFKGSYNEFNNLNNENLDTINTISAYLNDHYKERITLNFLSKKFSYSTSYLSRLFSSSYGESFIDIYDKLRINYSLNDLLIKSKSKTINEIALENGFDDVRSYVRAFKKIYQMTPKEYRVLMSKKTINNIQADDKLLRKQTLDLILSKYDTLNEIKKGNAPSQRSTEYILQVDNKLKTENLNYYKNKVLEVDNPSDLLNEKIGKCISLAINECKYDYVLLFNLLRSEPKVFFKNEENQLDIYYVYIHEIVSKIINNHALPYFVLEYDPSLYTEEEFYSLVTQMVNFLINYFHDSLSNAIFSISITPNKLLGVNDTKFLNLVSSLKRSLLAMNPTFKFASPFFNRKDILNSNEYKTFLDKTKNTGLEFDFYPIRYMSLIKEEEFLAKTKHELRNFISYLKENELFIENKTCLHSINFSYSNNLLNDNLYSSSYLIHNFIENVLDINTFSKTSLIDKKSLSAFDANPYQGKRGMFTYNSIKKSSYNAYFFLSKLEKNILLRERNVIVTRNENKVVIILNNYIHYSDLFADKEYFQISNLNRYNCFPKSPDINFIIKLTSMPYRYSEYKIYEISKASGSSYDKWLSMGAKRSLNYEEIDHLKNVSELNYVYNEDYLTHNSLTINVNVSPLETKLIEITFK